MNINKTKPPKDREFLAFFINDYSYTRQWEFFKWNHDLECFEDRCDCTMPNIIGWIEVPDEPELEEE